MTFSELGLSAALLETLATLNYKEPTPIQEAAIPAILKGNDILGVAQTGSGKTASFVLPVLMNLQRSEPLKNRKIKVLVLVPTRELAIQVDSVFKQFAQVMEKRIKTLAVFGGVSINPQMISMQNVHILTATPGRLLELIENKALQLSDVETLILDEADKMLNRSFEEEISQLLALLPKKRQNLLFSATLSKNVKNIKQVILHDPTVIKIAPKVENIEQINQSAYLVTEEKKGPLLRYLIQANDYQQVLVFVSSAFNADKVAYKLNNNAVNAISIHSKKSQGARTKALEKFKNGEIRVLVTTDLLSRGIDIEFLPCVINYELPRSPKDYIHRIGRTGRAEASGDAIALVTEAELHHFKVIQKKMKKWIKLTYSEEIDLHGF
ncbi:MAG: ATP-dependent RNA helicase RhlE [Cognaticolwellia sp.]|jgi:ATP-dependent RNA helicase RhlE